MYKNTLNEDNFIETLEQNIKNMPKERSVIDGQVVQVLGEFVFVEVGLKSEGRIPKSEFKNCQEKLKIGTNTYNSAELPELTAYVLGWNG